MAESPRIEVVPTDHFPCDVVASAPGSFVDWVVDSDEPLRVRDRAQWLRSVGAAVGPQWIAWWSSRVELASRSVGDLGSTFIRMIDVPGDQLPRTLATWWRDGVHVDDRLRLDPPRVVRGTWSFDGVLRTTASARALPVELLLSPYSSWWTKLELMPRRAVRPSRRYFLEGNGVLDRFVLAIQAQDGHPTSRA